MGTVKVVPGSLTEAYKKRQGDFAPNLVGFQFTEGASLFTFGNFEITTNLSNKLSTDFILGGEWSNYYSLDTLNLTESTSTMLASNDIFVKLNFNPFNINRYVYFGSFYEFARVTLEEIIQEWKGSIYLNPTSNTNTPVNTILSFNYNSGTNITSFLIPKSVITNNFQLIVDSNNNFSSLSPTDIYNLSRDYNKYVIWAGGDDFPVIGYTGSTTTYPYITIQTEGNPFPSLTASTFGQLTYHLKPNATEVQLFFSQLADFNEVLLNRLTTPIYTASFTVPIEANGITYTTTKDLTWPVSDGYNIDINTQAYTNYVQDLLAVADDFDQNKTDLVSRRFVSESIHEFDTNGGGNQLYGMKVTKLLRIYGREFDEVKKYIDGISFANVVTYDKLDNTSDDLIKMMASNLGFDTILTVGTDNFDILQVSQPSLETPFSGHSRGLSAKELDIELWRRLVINAWWLFKSKGTRKVIEFFFNLFKIPGCMVSLDEYVYLAENRLDVNSIYNQIVNIYNFAGLTATTPTLSSIPMDTYGFPMALTETNDNYFQMGGFWYNGGNQNTNGNNPHIGPYDYGVSYFNQFECFVPNFNQLVTGGTTVIVEENYFNNYNHGTFVFDQTGLPVPYYSSGYANSLNTNGLVQNAIVNSAGLTYVGGSNAPNYGVPSGDTYSMKISFTTGTGTTCTVCATPTYFGDDGIVYIQGTTTPLNDFSCCHNYWLPSPTTLGGPVFTTKPPYKCYWCPPNPQVVCNPDDYISTLSSDAITNLAIELGWNNQCGLSTTDFLSSALTSLFTKLNGCLILTETNDIISNKACCTLSGGNLVMVDNINYCVQPPPVNPCDNATVNPTHVYITPAGDLLPEGCCSIGTWTDGTVTVTEGSETVTIIDSVGLGFANQLSSNNYCSACPTSINISPTNLIITDSNRVGLTQNCCVDYGYNYDTVNNICYTCPPPKAIGYSIVSGEVLFNGLSLFEVCCKEYATSTNNSNISWDATSQKCLIKPAEPTSYTIQVGNEIKCPLCTLSGVHSTLVYVPNGYTILNATTLYTNSALTIPLNYNFIQYGGSIYSYSSGSGVSSICIAGGGC